MTDRVSTAMKRSGVLVLVIGIVGAIWYLSRSASKTSAAESATPPPPKPSPIAKVTRLGSVEERQLLAERIEHARAERQKSSPSSSTGYATHAPAPPRLPEPEPAISHVQIKAAMREVIPMIAECYEAALPALPEPHLEIVAEMHLSGDPDIGTIIDAKQLRDQTDQPLPTVLDDCLRSTFQTLALPPLAEGDEIDVRYPFVFDKR